MERDGSLGQGLRLFTVDGQSNRQRRVQGLQIGCARVVSASDIQGFFADKNVNVVSPLGGQFSWYTNWDNDGSKQYQTYMTKELPPLINAQYKANRKNAVGGLSSTGGTAVDYAIQAPGLYRAVGSYSGLLTPADDPQ